MMSVLTIFSTENAKYSLRSEVMGVYIKGLNKKDISDLRVHKYGGAYEYIDYENIVEVKAPHGRLIDADELWEHIGRDRLDSRELIMKMVDNAPTVIEAEVE